MNFFDLLAVHFQFIKYNYRDQQLSDVENLCDMKIIEDDCRNPASSKKSNEMEKSSSGIFLMFMNKMFYQ